MAKKPKSEVSENPINEADLAKIRHFIQTTEMDAISDTMRDIVEQYMPDLVYKLPPTGDQQAEDRREPTLEPSHGPMHRWKDQLVPDKVSEGPKRSKRTKEK
jgi:hypothetical protein